VLVVWPALGIAVVGIVAGLVVVALRALRAWRAFKGTKRALGERLDAIAHSTGEIETHISRAAEGSERLTEALGQLRSSRARLNVQLSALREARAAVGRVLPFLAR
jgi:uncharacterized membrane-anchored protein YhcB (DUF1043 family)